MKKMVVWLIFAFSVSARAQETSLLFKEADNFEYQFKEQEALNKYKDILVIEPLNIKALTKATELSCSIGARLLNKTDKRISYESALAYAQRAVKADSNSADVYYALALASGKMTEVEPDNKKVISFVRDTKLNADKALKINPKHALANFIEGKWHFEMITLNWVKRIAAKTLYGGLPNPDIDSAIEYLEKSRCLDPYFLLNTILLAKAYRENNKPAKEIEILTVAIKSPIRRFDDNSLRADAQKRLQELQ
jgi:predicted Zn-dependent protease